MITEINASKSRDSWPCECVSMKSSHVLRENGSTINFSSKLSLKFKQNSPNAQHPPEKTLHHLVY